MFAKKVGRGSHHWGEGGGESSSYHCLKKGSNILILYETVVKIIVEGFDAIFYKSGKKGTNM